jgi:photosystem II stability/assembly factor-like uncharacterized protein
MKKLIKIITIALIFAINQNLYSQTPGEEKPELSKANLSGLKFRDIGPALASGRIVDIAVNPNNYSEFYLAVASGGVFKTTNRGISFQPIFDNYGSYSTGCVVIDPNNTNVVWVGSGENNSQRSVSYGDGIYKSEDGGKSFKNMGLKNSEHIGKIVIDPRNSDVVYVAAQGPLWKAGGDRGLYKTTDGGENWELIKEISENTGFTDIVMDPRNPDVLYAASYQRRRRVWTLLNGGPESALYKSEDAGKTWEKITKGLPSGYVGRIGLGISPANPDYVYALIEADGGGLYRSTDRGASWSKQNKFTSSSAQYYQEIICHPNDPDILFMVSTYTQFSTDGGKTLQTINQKEKHVDDHALWINPENPDNMLIGNDGGLYETFDGAKNWRFISNLSLTQFYRVTVDNAEPFYNIYGGTQDNNTIGGPTRTQSAHGLMNQDFYYTVGGDGFKTVVDPTDPNILYSQPQYGFLVRYDKRSGEITGVQPQAEKDEELIWNWNSPVIISPHDHKTLYFAGNKLFKSTNRGNSWTKISEDLSRQIDRNTLKTMGKVWDPEIPSKNASTSLYGNIVALDESPVKQGLLYVGTDDGLIQVSEDDGNTWRKISKFVGVPETTYVSDIQADLFDENTVYATFDNRKSGDFTPYIMKSTDKGQSWQNIATGIPEGASENLPVHSIIQDHVNKDLLFIGTEFGVYFTKNNGADWIKLSAGLPTICVKELDIQRRESDLALGTFGRGFFILDDYSPLRTIDTEILEKEAHIFPVKDEWLYIEDRSQGRRSRGENFWRGENKEYGAVFSYYIGENYETLEQKRNKKEKEIMDKGGTITYPTWEEFRAEDREKKPALLFVVKDSKGEIVRHLVAPYSKGLHRLNWDLRYPDTAPKTAKSNPNKEGGFPVMPGEYSVELYKEHNGQLTKLAGPEQFNLKVLDNKTLPAADFSKLQAFHKDAFALRRTIEGANKFLAEAREKHSIYEQTALATNQLPTGILNSLQDVEELIYNANLKLNGDATKSKRNERQAPSISGRLGTMLYAFWYSSSDATETNKRQIEIISEEYDSVHNTLQSINSKLAQIRVELDKYNAPWTPGELPLWKK